jgi:hypothetical protein
MEQGQVMNEIVLKGQLDGQVAALLGKKTSEISGITAAFLVSTASEPSTSASRPATARPCSRTPRRRTARETACA